MVDDVLIIYEDSRVTVLVPVLRVHCAKRILTNAQVLRVIMMANVLIHMDRSFVIVKLDLEDLIAS